MDLLFVSPRVAPGDPPSPARERVAGLVRAAAAAGHTVRWVLPLAPGESVPEAGAVEVLGCESAVPPLHQVQDRLYQVGLEAALATSVRARLPDLVHVDGYGGVSSYLTSWLPARLGAPVVTVVDSIEDLVCTRRTLRDQTGSACTVWDDAERCHSCVSEVCGGGPHDGELSAWRGRLARATRGLGPFSRTPRVGDFANRLDMVIHGLDAASLVLVRGEAEREILHASRLPMRSVVVGFPAEPDLRAWMEVYSPLLSAG